MSRWLRWGAATVAVVVAAVLLGRVAGERIPEMVAWVEGLGPWGPVALIAAYLVTSVAMAPGAPLSLAAGALFGLFWGTVYTLVGATLGAVAGFLVSRYVARDMVERRLRRYPRFQRIDRAIGREGLKVVFLLRLSPAFPFNLLNYALGLTRVRFLDFLVASVGMLPGTLLYVYYGKLAGEVAALGAGRVQRGPGYYLLLLLGLLATVAATVLVTRLARRALQEETSDAEPAHP